MNMPVTQIIDRSATTCPWSFFERIYCISLKSRPDRQQEARTQFQRVGLGDRVQFMIVEKHPTDTEQGIYESHIACLREGLESGAKNILVFEDDVVFEHFSHEVLQQCVAFMNSEQPWKIFFLGCFVWSSSRTSFQSVVNLRFRHAAHAYAIGREFAAAVAQKPWCGIAFDDLLRSMDDGQYYSAYPSLAFQSGSSTDNDKLRGLDRFRRIFGGTRRLQRWNEFTRHRMVELIIAHVAAIAVISLVLICRYRHG